MQHEKEESDELRQKYAEVQESSEERRKKLADTEARLHHLQESLHRYSDTFRTIDLLLLYSSLRHIFKQMFSYLGLYLPLEYPCKYDAFSFDSVKQLKFILDAL